MRYLALLRFFLKEKGKYTLTFRCSLILPRIQHKVVLLVLEIAWICRRFLITQFIATEALGNNSLSDRG